MHLIRIAPPTTDCTSTRHFSTQLATPMSHIIRPTILLHFRLGDASMAAKSFSNDVRYSNRITWKRHVVECAEHYGSAPPVCSMARRRKYLPLLRLSLQLDHKMLPELAIYDTTYRRSVDVRKSSEREYRNKVGYKVLGGMGP